MRKIYATGITYAYSQQGQSAFVRRPTCTSGTKSAKDVEIFTFAIENNKLFQKNNKIFSILTQIPLFGIFGPPNRMSPNRMLLEVMLRPVETGLRSK